MPKEDVGVRALSSRRGAQGKRVETIAYKRGLGAGLPKVAEKGLDCAAALSTYFGESGRGCHKRFARMEQWPVGNGEVEGPTGAGFM